jgi:hypothetical protein
MGGIVVVVVDVVVDVVVVVGPQEVTVATKPSNAGMLYTVVPILTSERESGTVSCASP